MNIAIIGEYGSHEFIRDSEIANSHGFVVVTNVGYCIPVPTEEIARTMGAQRGCSWHLAVKPAPWFVENVAAPVMVPSRPLAYSPMPETVYEPVRPAA